MVSEYAGSCREATTDGFSNKILMVLNLQEAAVKPFMYLSNDILIF